MIKIPSKYFVDTGKPIPKRIWKGKESKIIKIISKMRKKDEEIALPVYKVYNVKLQQSKQCNTG